MGNETRRLFASIDLPPDVQKGLAEVQQAFESISGVRLVEPSGTHVTLKFFGDVPPDRVDDVRTILENGVASADLSPFEARFGGLGVFPDFEYISVIWIGVRDGASAMTTLHEHIESLAVDAEFDPEEHDFTPHVTIARLDHGGGKEAVQEQVRQRDPAIGSMTVDEIRLKESHLTPAGPEYETIERIRLD